MSEPLNLKYYHGDEPDNLCFYRIPKVLFTKACFEEVSTDAKVLYGILLDYASLSRENRWLDEESRVYIHYSVQKVCAYMGCKKDKAMKLLADLEGFGLIERIKRGQGKSDIIYVKSFEVPEDAEDREEIKRLKKDTDHRQEVVEKTDRSEKPTSRSLENRPLEVGKTDPNNTIQNNNKYSDTCPVQSCHNTGDDDEEDDWLDHIDCSKPIRITGYYPKMERQDRQDEIQPDKAAYIDYLRDCIGYEDMIREERYRFEKEKIDGIINMIADVATTTPPDGKEWVNSRPYSHEVVKSRLLKMDRLIMEHVLDRMKENTTRIKNMRSYLLTVLYNAKDEREMSVDSQVNYDWYGGGLEKKGVAYA